MRFHFGLSENDSLRIRIIIAILAETGSSHLEVDKLCEFFTEMSERVEGGTYPNLYPSSREAVQEFLSRSENEDCLRVQDEKISVLFMGLLRHGVRNVPEPHMDDLKVLVSNF